MIWRLAAFAASVLWASAVEAREEESPRGIKPLSLEEVLASVDATHPVLSAAEQSVKQAEGKQLAARGAWDPKLRAQGTWAPVGYYETAQLDVVLSQATPWWGARGFAGYRLGRGDFPIYKGELQTLSQGELRAGVEVPLWKDGPIDARRAAIAQSKALTQARHCDLQAIRLKVRNQAAYAYWRWVAAGQEVRIQAQLLEVARRRDAGLREQAVLGGIPAIVVVDNERLVLDRESKLIDAQRAFQEATLALSLFLRDSAARSVRVSEERVPPAMPDLALPPLRQEAADLEVALRDRPELCAMARDQRAAQVRERLARNQKAPDVSARAFVARDVGAGPSELSPLESGVGVTFELPLALREARGEHIAAEAALRGLTAQRRGLSDRIAVEVRQARVDLAAAQQQVDVVQRQLAVAEALAEAEREKFMHGASDLVVVNLREIAAADAARLEVKARAAVQMAFADYLAAIGAAGVARSP